METKLAELVIGPPPTLTTQIDLESGDDLSDEENIVIAKEELNYDDDSLTIEGDLSLDIELLRKLPCPYTNIIGEFADVEIFMISIDSMLIEFTAHGYHNWELGGQTIVLAEQINKFLNSLADLNAKFILVWFSDLKGLYEKDSCLSFLHSFTIAYLTKNLAKWEATIECFSSLLDEKWNDLLHRLTPSFLLMSLENPKEDVFNEIDFASRFISTAIQLITNSIPVVFFNAFSVNFSTVMAYRLSTIPLSVTNLEEKIAEKWDTTYEKILEVPTRAICSEIQNCKNPAEFWAEIIKSELASSTKTKKKEVDKDFENLCIAVLISALICDKLKINRQYPDIDAKKGPSIQNRRRLRDAATKKLYTIEYECLNFDIEDLWDGRLIYRIYRKIAAKEKILPFRLQEDFAKLHNKIGLKTSVATDESEVLFEQLSPSEDPSQRLLIRDLELFNVQNELLDEFVPDIKKLLSETKLTEHGVNYANEFVKFSKWVFKPIVEDKLRMEIPEKLTDHRAIKRRNRERQKHSSFFQNFADSLEGRGNDLLVDFSRTPRLTTVDEDENNENIANGATDRKSKKGGKPVKVEKLSKKDQILKANKDALNKKQIESDKTKISFANQVKANAIIALEDVFRKLELNESKALCIYEKVLRHVEIFNDKLPTFENLEQKRDGALDLVETIKICFRKYFDYFDALQKEKIMHIWALLGFVKTTKRLTAVDKLMDLEMNLVDYQLYHGGRLIDILSDPKKDDRVVGFAPDGWQRKMLDVVDQYQSALIVAPTSAGKTFVSYYCIEKVLRNSNEDVVVYISPSKSLMNQVLGSIYARFRNKPMGNNKVLFGTFTLEYSDNVLNCQVLVTIPECLEIILLSQDPQVQQFVSRIKYVILDEMHCINAPVAGNRVQGHIWEHIFLLLRCPFLALSATISNVEVVQEWFQKMEDSKVLDGGGAARQVKRITYDERWSELELAIQRMRECPKNITYSNDNDLFTRGASVQSILPKEDSPDSAVAAAEIADNDSLRTPTPSMSEVSGFVNRELSVQQFHPYSVYKLEKLKMFGIPEDQRMTARQVVELYTIMAEIDGDVKEKFLPCRFFNYEVGSEMPVWLSRKDLRNYENKLKETIIEWLNASDKEKINKVFQALDLTIHDEFEKRSKPFNMRNSALHNITPLVDNLVKSNRLPALCFNDDRDICEQLSVRLFNELERRENAFRASPEFNARFNSKAEEKAAKLAKRRRDEEEKEKKKTKKKKTTMGEDGKREGGRYDKEEDWQDSTDQFILQRIKLEEELSKFKVLGRWSDEDIFNKTVTRLSDRAGNRPSTQMLLRLFKRGIGFHHDGLNATERGSVEILFRNGFLGIVFSTSTLALGMNMPCKTVVFGIDTPMLTPLQFRQMSGRAGRRGFDPAGTVIFMALPTSKIRRLLTSSLATLRGNVPYTTSFMLRLLTYIKGSTIEEYGSLTTNTIQMTNKEKSAAKRKPQIETTDVTNVVVRRKAVLTLLKNPFALYTRKQHREGVLSNLLKALTLFNVQQLLKQQLLNNKAEPIGFANLAVHLSKFEQGNLAFINLLQTGALHRLHAHYQELDERDKFKDVLINILAYLFTNKPLPIFAYKFDENSPEAPILKPIPEEVEKVITEYNQSVDKLLVACLQWASPNQQIEDTVFRLTGNTKESLSTFKNDVVSVFDEDLVLDPMFIPAFSSEQKDHRGRKILRNSYVYDFWKKADRKSLVENNKLLISEIWYMIKDFHMVLSAITVGLKKMRESDPISLILAEIEKEFLEKFNTAFGMQKKENKTSEEIKK